MKCEQGDLAKIIMSVRPTNVGKTVLVAEYIGHFQSGENFNFRGINCTALITDHYWWIESEFGLKNQLGETPRAYIPDTWLEPIRPEKTVQKEDVKLDIFA
jgi:hypothetical protein